MSSNLNEEIVSTRSVFKGKVIQLDIDNVQLPNGKLAEREVVHHPGAVGILAVNSNKKVILIKQFRRAIERITIEIPAGKLEKNENPLDCAYRELKEETGYTATFMEKISQIYTSPGFADEIIHIYKAEGLQKGDSLPDEDEFVEMIELSLDEIDELIKNGEIMDSKTLVALYYLKNQIIEK